MIQANIAKENEKQIVYASGEIPELLTDITVLVSGIYTQLKNASPETAEIFRTALTSVMQDQNGPMWKAIDGQTGIVFRKPNMDE